MPEWQLSFIAHEPQPQPQPDLPCFLSFIILRIINATAAARTIHMITEGMYSIVDLLYFLLIAVPSLYGLNIIKHAKIRMSIATIKPITLPSPLKPTVNSVPS